MQIFDPVLGDPKYAGEQNRVLTKGNLVGWRKRYVMDAFGEAGVDDVAGRLSEASRAAFLDPPAAFAWTPIAPMYEIDCAIVRGPMQGDVSKMFDFGVAIGTGDLSTIYKLVLRLIVSPKMLVGRLPEMWKTYFRVTEGAIEAEAVDGDCFVSKNLFVPYYLCNFGVTGWLTAGGQLTGANDFAAVHEQCVHRGDPVCAWRFQW